MAGQNPSNPIPSLSQSIPNIPNLNQSPFPSIQSYMGQGSNNTQRGQNPQSPISGQNPPNFGGGGQTLIQSNNQLITAINRLTQAFSGGGGGSSGQGSPMHRTPGASSNVAGSLISQIATNPNTFGGLKPGTGVGGMLLNMGMSAFTGTQFAQNLSPGTRAFAQATGNTVGNGLMSAAAYGGALGGGIAGASSAQGMFGAFSSIPFVGGLLSSLGTGFGVAQNRFSEMNNYEKVATMTSLQLNQAGRSRLDLRPGGNSTFRGMNAMANDFRPLGIGPTEGAGLLGQMLTATGALNGAAHMEVGGIFNPNIRLGLPAMMRQGYSAGTVGFSQRLRGDLFGNTFMGANADGLQSAAFGMGRTMGFNDPMQAQFMQDIYSMQTGRAMSGASRGFNIGEFRGGLGAFSSLGFGENSMQGLMQREGRAGGLGTINSPFAGLADNMLRFGFMKQAGFDTLKAQELQQSATGAEKFKMLTEQVGIDQAKRLMQGAGFNANEIKSFAAEYQGEVLGLTAFEKYSNFMGIDKKTKKPIYKEEFVGNEVAKTGAELEADRVQNRRDVIMKTAILNQEIENSQIDFLGKHFTELSQTVRQLNEVQKQLLGVTASVVKEFSDLAAEMQQKVVMSTIASRLNPLNLVKNKPKSPEQIKKDVQTVIDTPASQINPFNPGGYNRIPGGVGGAK